MIIGVGIDMVEVSRITEKIAKGNGFREQVFSSAEIAYCEKSSNPSESYAARFAAKEAFLKATGLGLMLTYELNQIEVVNNEQGRPGIRLLRELEGQARLNDWNKIHLSLSHTSSAAGAVVIIES
jgi:holo-[acyl-carrier protein] synthase